MDADEPLRRPDALVALSREDLSPLSAAELRARLEALGAEIARVETHLDRAEADAIFRR